MPKRKRKPEKMYEIKRGIENSIARFEPGDVVTEHELKSLFDHDVLNLWIARGVIVPVADSEADNGPER